MFVSTQIVVVPISPKMPCAYVMKILTFISLATIGDWINKTQKAESKPNDDTRSAPGDVGVTKQTINQKEVLDIQLSHSLTSKHTYHIASNVTTGADSLKLDMVSAEAISLEGYRTLGKRNKD